jgi:hypothetical protein
LRHDLHFGDASSFRIGVARPADGVERQACARLAAIAFDFEPTQAADDGLSVIFTSSM